ncbi:MAG TPA: hypothetical protein VGK30_20875 [Candidatus Binatia bacterium]
MRRLVTPARNRRGSALVVAVLALALAGAAAALLAELARSAVVRARVDRDGTRAWFLAEAGLADTLAALAPGTSFTDVLRHGGPSGAPAPGSYLAVLRDDADDHPDDPLTDVNATIVADVTAAGPAPVRRRLEAVLGREPAPYLPGAATLAGSVSNLTGGFRLDGHDGAMNTGCTMLGDFPPRAGAALPPTATAPVPADPAQIDGVGGPPSVVRRNAPDLTPLATSPGAVHVPSSPFPAALGTEAAPQLTVVDGDAEIAAASSGAGTLYATGHLRVSGRLDFTGVVAAAGGVEVTATGELWICGALWAAGAPALDARGTGSVHASGDAIALAARVAPLPARARALAVRELF